MEDGVTSVGTQCFVPHETDMCVWFDKKYVIPHEDFVIDVSNAQAYKQFGNAVTVNVSRAVAEQVRNKLEEIGEWH